MMAGGAPALQSPHLRFVFFENADFANPELLHFFREPVGLGGLGL